jgi:hypothetical protein
MIPNELRKLPQWVVAGPDKVPVNPKLGSYADVTVPATWGTYEEACKAAELNGLPHVGFVLTTGDPFSIIDLDRPHCRACQSDTCEHARDQVQRHERILAAFPSYTEFSQSGTGLHIIVRGSVPHGCKRDRVEVYSDSRYMICTGKVFRDSPIASLQETLDALFAQMAPVNYGEELSDYSGTLTDEEVFETAANASNSDKFHRLCCGDWENEWPSQSEADFALLSMFAFYTRDNEQVRRLFRMSALGKREKAQRDDYLNRALRKIRANEPPVIDFSNLALPAPDAPVPAVSVEEETPASPRPLVASSITPPPGLIGELAAYIHESSSRPVPEIATCAALAMVAGIVGRQYNISGTGLNQYIIMLARTGVGKEEAASGIDRIISAVRPTVPMVDQFIGPGAFASGQAIIRTLDEQPCMLSVLGEFGLTLQALSDANANGNSLILRRVLLDLFNKSGWGKVLRSSAYSDREKNTKTVVSPALTILGESTPETFYAGLSQSHIADGLVPRFLVVEYRGDRPGRNISAFAPPPPALVKRVVDLVSTVLAMSANHSCCDVPIDPDAQTWLDDYDRHCDLQIHIGGNEVVRQLWNRAHLKSLRLAALVAVGVNPHAPLVTRVEAEWATSLVTSDVERMVDRFDTGDVGEGDSKQLVDLWRIIAAYIAGPFDKLGKYPIDRSMWEKRVVPYRFLIQRTASLPSFKADRRGSTAALKSSLETLVASARVVEIGKEQMVSQFGNRGAAWFVPE